MAEEDRPTRVKRAVLDWGIVLLTALTVAQFVVEHFRQLLRTLRP